MLGSMKKRYVTHIPFPADYWNLRPQFLYTPLPEKTRRTRLS